MVSSTKKKSDNKIHLLPGGYYLGNYYDPVYPDVYNKEYRTIRECRSQAYKEVLKNGWFTYVFKYVGYEKDGKKIRTHVTPIGYARLWNGKMVWCLGRYSKKPDNYLMKDGTLGRRI